MSHPCMSFFYYYRLFMNLEVQNLTYIHPDKEILFQGVGFSVSENTKCAISGHNGCGKSTLLKIMAHRLRPASGIVFSKSKPYFIPQHFGQYDSLTVAAALGVSDEIRALHAILDGDVSENNLTCLNDKWDIEEQAVAALDKWHIGSVALDTSLSTLSGGEKTKVFLAGISLHDPEIILMDEPTNHLDLKGREMLYEYILQSSKTVVVVSHDRTLLNLMSAIYEMSAEGIRFYPVGYDEYKAQKDAELRSKMAQLQNRQKELRKARKEARDAMERRQKHNARGEKLSEKKGVARIVMGNLKDRAEHSTSRLGRIQQERLQAMHTEIRDIRSSVVDTEAMKIDFHSSDLYAGKRLLDARQINFAYGGSRNLWQDNLDVTVFNGEHIWLTGDNGSGKSTLLKLITGELEPTEGIVYRSANLRYVYLDQEYSLIKDDNTILEQVASFNSVMMEHELKICLNRFLFPQSVWDKGCACLSGGERMRLALCCLMVSRSAPDIIIADEPTNNIDIANIDMLTSMLKEYKGTLIVVSHDMAFIEELKISRKIDLRHH